MTIIYKYTNLINGKVYVGKTARTLAARQAEHVYVAKTKLNVHWGNALLKWGISSFVREVICEIEDEFGAFVETLFIAALRSSDHRYGYNSTDGGEGVSGWHHTQETRKQISESVKKNPKGFFIKNRRYGKRSPEEVLKSLRTRYGSDYVPRGESLQERAARRKTPEQLFESARKGWLKRKNRPEGMNAGRKRGTRDRIAVHANDALNKQDL